MNSFKCSGFESIPTGLERGSRSHKQYILTALAIEFIESKLRAKTGEIVWIIHLTCCQVGSFHISLLMVKFEGNSSGKVVILTVEGLIEEDLVSIESRSLCVRVSTTSIEINFLLFNENSAKIS